MLHTSKSNISCDLSAGEISSARLSRIRRMAVALGMTFIPTLVTKQKEKMVITEIQKLLAA
jgi:hypothetical protein